MTRRIFLTKAKKGKNDEFYTRLEDIERELKSYKEHFKDKIVYCNCDDPRVSNFFHYFSYNFKYLGLKKLITTCYQNQDMNLFSDYNSNRAIKLEYTGETDGGNIPKEESINIEYLDGDGDFRSEECIEFLKEADIVVTNPPFSLFREYVSQLMEYDKRFLIIGNINAITYKEIFPLIKENKVWLGTGMGRWISGFIVPDNYELYGSEAKIDEMGNRIVSTNNCLWLTNLEHKKRHEDIILYKRYNPIDYPKYDNYDAINVNKVVDIPEDYAGVIGVPITFLDKYNPEQFEIIGLGNSRENFSPTKDYINPKKVMRNGKVVNGGAINQVLAIEVKEKPVNRVYYTSDNSGYLTPPYARVLIKNKKVRK